MRSDAGRSTAGADSVAANATAWCTPPPGSRPISAISIAPTGSGSGWATHRGAHSRQRPPSPFIQLPHHCAFLCSALGDGNGPYCRSESPYCMWCEGQPVTRTRHAWSWRERGSEACDRAYMSQLPTIIWGRYPAHFHSVVELAATMARVCLTLLTLTLLPSAPHAESAL